MCEHIVYINFECGLSIVEMGKVEVGGEETAVPTATKEFTPSIHNLPVVGE